MNHEAVLSFAYDDAQRARRVAESVRPEVGAIAGDRTRATMERDGDAVTVTVEAEDLTALRAGLNTWQRLVAVAERAGDATPA